MSKTWENVTAAAQHAQIEDKEVDVELKSDVSFLSF